MPWHHDNLITKTALYYADDLVLVANTDADMQGMLDVLDDYSREWKFQVSAGKTKVLRFGKQAKPGGGKGRGRPRSQPPRNQIEGPGRGGPEGPLYLPSMHGAGVDGGPGSHTNPVAEATEYTYLGVTFQTDGTFDQHIRSKANMNGVEHRLRGCLVKAAGIPPRIGLKLIAACAGGVLRYGAAA